MASLSDFVSTQGSGNAPQGLANFALDGSQSRIDAGLAQTRLLRQFSDRALPALVNRYAAKGTFYGGQAGVQSDQLKEDYTNDFGDIQRQLNARLADLRRQGILAATGQMI